MSFTFDQLATLIAAYLFPWVRVLALLATAPPFNNPSVPIRIRVILALAISVAIAPTLPKPEAVPVDTLMAWVVIGEQIIIGVAMGFAVRIAFLAVDFAGEIAALQMGLGFASFFDPQNGGQSPVFSEFLGVLVLLVFLAIDGHLLTIATLVQSFHAIPVSDAPLMAQGFSTLVLWGARIFSAGLLLALPILTAMLIANLALSVLARVAPTLNLFAVGFPITLSAGLLVASLSIPYLATPLRVLFEQALAMMLGVATQLSPIGG